MIPLSTIMMAVCFIAIVLLILTEKINRAVLAISGAIVTYFVLIFIEQLDFSIIVDLLFGSNSEGYVNLHSLMLIIGMMFIVHISDEIGVFQFLAVIAIKLSKGRPIPLMIIFCIVSVIFSSILNNILTVMILIPLTITVSRVLNVDPTPYILTEAILVNIGGTIFAISSIPNILIVTSAGITFNEYFINLGLFSIVTVFLSISFFVFLYKNELVIPIDEAINTLLYDFDVWNVVQSKRLLYLAIGALTTLMVAFIVIPPDILPPDILALSVAMGLTVVSGLNAEEIIDKLDFELILYLLGIFVIAGGLEIVGIIQVIGDMLKTLGGNDQLAQLLLILWLAAISSSMIDNVPITKVLIPIVDNITTTTSVSGNSYYYSLAIGANWGDNLTPLGDNILVLNIAEQNQRPIKIKTFWKLGFTTTILQLIVATIYFVLLTELIIGLLLVTTMVGIIIGLSLANRFGSRSIKHHIHVTITNVRRVIIQ